SRLADLALGTAQRAPGATVRLAIGGEIQGFDGYEAVADEQDASDLEDPVLGTTMLYTSGTTGRPKGVYRRQPIGAGATTRTVPVYGYRPGEDVHLCTGPLYHAAPLAFSLAIPLLCGVTVVLMDGWDAEETLRLVDRQTWLAHPGTVGKPVDPEGVRICDADGSPLPAGEVGLVFLKAPAVGRFEYFKDSNKTADAYRGEYFTLGDMGYKDEEGFLY